MNLLGLDIALHEGKCIEIASSLLYFFCSLSLSQHSDFWVEVTHLTNTLEVRSGLCK